jgi:hypothetical protein
MRKYYSGNHIKHNEVGGICGTYMGEGEVHTGCRYGNLREREDLEDLGIDGRIRKCTYEEMAWIRFVRHWRGTSGRRLCTR